MNFNDLCYISDQMYERTKIPLVITDDRRNILFPKLSVSELSSSLFDYSYTKNKYKLYIISDFALIFSSFHFTVEDMDFVMFIGPAILLDSTLDYQVQYNGHTFNLAEKLSKETVDSFIEYSRLVYLLINRKSIADENIFIKYLKESSYKPLHKQLLQENLYIRRSEDSTRDSYQLELRYIEYVKSGRKDKIEWIFKKIPETYHVDLSENPLENYRLKFSAIVSLLTRTAINEGVPLDRAFALSDSLIQGLKNIHSVQKCIDYMKYATFEFMEAMCDHKNSYSLVVKQIISFIDTNIYNKITLDDLVQVTGKTKNYISTRFKQEVGCSIFNYFFKKKIEEAQQLLLFTDHTYKEISSLLNFASQSHFIERFKKITGLTPKAFREKHFQYM